MIKVIPFKKHPGNYNMDLDLYLFNNHENGAVPATVRFYGWEGPCISLGYTQDASSELNMTNCKKYGVEVIKRPTGGGIVFHNEHEITYSIVCARDDKMLPKGLVESYRAISSVIVQALRNVGIDAELSSTRSHDQARLCFSYPASYEIILEDNKIVGSAQKRGKNTLLQQGSIFIKNSDIKIGDLVRNAVEFKSIYDILGYEPDKKAILRELTSGFKQYFD